MSSSARRLEFQPSVATSVRVDRRRFHVLLADGREISAPLDRFPRLRGGTREQLSDCTVTAFGSAIRWPQLDEDIGVAALLGIPEDDLEAAAGFELGEPDETGR